MKTLRTPADLAARGLVDEGADLREVAARYAIAAPPAMTQLIDVTDRADPIARQIVPSAAELHVAPGEDVDPIGDDAHSPVEGIVHRYPDRVLLKLVHVCAVYCRFCFRREMVGPGKPNALSKPVFDAALDYIRANAGIWEVILTGGDPLVLSPRRLREVMKALAAIEHVKVIRIHTRVPVADPSRVTADMARALRVKGKAVYVGLHVNHARELSPSAREACARIVDAGIPMVSQTVLLSGVNDNEKTMGELMRALVECRVKPYYLHHGDLAPGTSHFRTDIEKGQSILRAMRGLMSGLCQPEYVLDIPGGYGKSPIGPSYLKQSNGAYEIEDFKGERHQYQPRVPSTGDGHQIENSGRNGKASKPDANHRADSVADITGILAQH